MPVEAAEDPEDRLQTLSRRGLAVLGAAVVLVVLLLYVGFRSDLPSDLVQLAELSQRESPTAGGRASPPPSPENAAAPTAQGSSTTKVVEPGAKPPAKPDEHLKPTAKTGQQTETAAKTDEPSQPTTDPSHGHPEPRPDALPQLPAGFPTEPERRANWPKFRGADGSGIAGGSQYPVKWDVASGAGIAWKAEVPLPGTSSPIVWGNRLFVTGATAERRAVYCFDTDSGRLLWAKEVADAAGGEPPKLEKSVTYAAPTPTTDGRRVYAIFPTGDVVAFDFAGNLRWSRTFGRPKSTYGFAASLAMYQDLLIVPLDQGGKQDKLSKLYALRAATGEKVWEAPREVPNSWSSPIVVEHDGKPLLLTAADPWAIAYSPTDGKELWRAECLHGDVAPSPAFANGLLVVANEFPGTTVLRAGGSGNVTKTHLAWQGDMNAPDCCSPLITDKFVLTLSAGGMLTCYRAKEGGEPLWEYEFKDARFASSPSMAGPYVYVFDDEGKAFVVEPTEKQCREIATAEMGEGVVASPAFVNGRIFVRGKQHLFCLGPQATTEDKSPPLKPASPTSSTASPRVSPPKPEAKPAPAGPAPDAKLAAPDKPSPAAAAAYPTEAERKQNWPKFRGPDGSGIAAGGNYPTKWNIDSGDGLIWKTEVPLPGASSPIVWGNRLFLTGATVERRAVCCFDADSGKLLWAKEVADAAGGEPPKLEKSVTYAAPTPTTDGRRVYAIFPTGDVVAFDFAGNLRWSRTFGRPKSTYGFAASLAIYQDLLIVPYDQGGKQDKLSKLMALRAATGETAWEASRPVPNSWSSPVVVQHDGKPMLVTSADPWVIAYSPTDGKELWRAECLQGDVAPSPAYADGMVVVANEFPGTATVRAGGSGDVTKTHVAWRSDVNTPDCCSPLITDKFVLTLSAGGMLTCFNAKQGGEPLWEYEFKDATFASSPNMAGPYVYTFDDEGKAFVVEPTEKQCREVATAEMGEGVVASPAFVGGRLYVRGKQHLFCIGSK
jgi:outer membrane protein assembly factor BamB